MHAAQATGHSGATVNVVPVLPPLPPTGLVDVRVLSGVYTTDTHQRNVLQDQQQRRQAESGGVPPQGGGQGPPAMGEGGPVDAPAMMAAMAADGGTPGAVDAPGSSPRGGAGAGAIAPMTPMLQQPAAAMLAAGMAAGPGSTDEVSDFLVEQHLNNMAAALEAPVSAFGRCSLWPVHVCCMAE